LPTLFTADFVEREYNNRALVPEHPEFFARWEKDSKYVRETLPCTLDVAYGPDERHRIDLFPAAGSRGTLLFIHGGYWRSLDKDMFSWLAASWVAAGVSVALPRYRLCPRVRIDDIVDDALAATNWLALNGSKYGIESERMVLSGHSAGGHLTAAIFAAPRERLQFDPARIVGGVPISGLFDFAPLLQVSYNSDLCLDAAAVDRLDLHIRKPVVAAPLVIAAGGDESSEFQRQSRLLAEAWKEQVQSLLIVPGYNHFSIVDAFAERGQPLYEESLGLF
jgi:arylformamidase